MLAHYEIGFGNFGLEAFGCFILLISTINSSSCTVFAKRPITHQTAKSKPQFDG